MTADPPLTSPGVRFPPPIILLGAFLLAWALDRGGLALPLSRVIGAAATRMGWLLLALGIAIAAWGWLTLRRARTAVIPHYPATQLVGGGPYRFTRNPMYLGMTTAYLGGTALIDSAWPLLLLPVALWLLVRLVISREEAYLSDAFGAE